MFVFVLHKVPLFSGCTRNKRKRPKQKLMVDEVKNLSIKEMESQMSDTTDIVTKVNLAPPTRRFMQWEETGGAKELFGLPGRPIPARSLFRVRKKSLLLFFFTSSYRCSCNSYIM